MPDTPPNRDALALHAAYCETFRFYIALTVFANLGYALVIGAFIVAAVLIDRPIAILLMIVPAMVSTGFAALSAFGVAEAFGLHRAIQSIGRALGLPHITRSAMLPVQTILTLIFHALIALTLFASVFFASLILLA